MLRRERPARMRRMVTIQQRTGASPDMAKRRQTIDRAKVKRKAAQDAKRTEKARKRETRAERGSKQTADAGEEQA